MARRTKCAATRRSSTPTLEWRTDGSSKIRDRPRFSTHPRSLRPPLLREEGKKRGLSLFFWALDGTDLFHRGARRRAARGGDVRPRRARLRAHLQSLRGVQFRPGLDGILRCPDVRLAYRARLELLARAGRDARRDGAACGGDRARGPAPARQPGADHAV